MSQNLYYSVRMRASKGGAHISGAEGIYERDDIQDILSRYSKRAFNHEKGRADEINLQIDRLKEEPVMISSIPLCTIKAKDRKEARSVSSEILSSAGIPESTIMLALESIESDPVMRGAIIMNTKGERLEPDKVRGVRVSMIGITKKAASDLSGKLANYKLDNDRVKEALILASKIQYNQKVIAELCTSDDPGYTTGYVSTKQHGYVRVTNIKNEGIPLGGRVIFVSDGKDDEIIEYLQHTPVMINEIGRCGGSLTLKEVLEGRPDH